MNDELLEPAQPQPVDEVRDADGHAWKVGTASRLGSALPGSRPHEAMAAGARPAISPFGSGRRRLQIDPSAQLAQLTVRTAAPAGLARRSPPVWRIATPARPTASPTHSPCDGQRPNNPANSATQSGTEAMATAATPELTHCSAITTQAFAHTSRVPTISDDRHSVRVGGGAPRACAQAYVTAPAITKRRPASSSGG